MKILFISNNYSIPYNLQQIGEEVWLLKYNDSDVRDWKTLKDFNIITYKDFNHSNCALIKDIKNLNRKIASYKFDSIIIERKRDILPVFLLKVFFQKNIKIIFISHNSYSWLKRLNVYGFTQYLRLSTDGIVALASFVSDKLIKCHYCADRVLLCNNVLYNLPQSYKVNYAFGDKINLVYIAVMSPQKGQLTLLRALKSLVKYNNKIVLNLIGDFKDQNYVDILQEFVKKNGLNEYVHFYNKVDYYDIFKILLDMDIYVCPSQMEMSPYNILEAAGIGLPIVTSNRGGIKDLIIDQFNGLIIENNESDQFSEKIITLINDEQLRKRLGNNARSFSANLLNSRAQAYKIKQFLASF